MRHSAKKIGWVLLAIGALSAAAALFGSAERLAGVDLGATGAAVFMFTLGGAIWLFAARGSEVFPEETSVAERRVWVGLVFLVVILAVFARELQMLAGHARIPEGITDFFGRRFIERYVMLGIAWAVLSHLIGRGERGIEADERDLRLRHRADRAGDWALSLTVVNAIAVLALVPTQLLSWWLTPVVLANVLIGLLIAKSLVEHLALAYSYRASSGRA